MYRREFVKGVLAVTSIGLAGCTEDDESSSNPGTSAGVEIVTSELNKSQNIPRVTGELLNNGSEPVTFVKIWVTFYEGEDRVLGSSVENMGSELKPGQTYPFDIMGAVASNKGNITRYEIELRDVSTEGG